eukprot:m.61229 g.61229  ORF g.61229 m.61229 type:complete len:566 (-) comp12333_c2_seq1:68-1765(-)
MIAHHLVVVPPRGACTVNDIVIEGCRTLSDVIQWLEVPHLAHALKWKRGLTHYIATALDTEPVVVEPVSDKQPAAPLPSVAVESYNPVYIPTVTQSHITCGTDERLFRVEVSAEQLQRLGLRAHPATRHFVKTSPHTLILIAQSPLDLKVFAWPLQLLRKYSVEGDTFFFTGGSRCEHAGEFALKSGLASEIFHTLKAHISALVSQLTPAVAATAIDRHASATSNTATFPTMGRQTSKLDPRYNTLNREHSTSTLKPAYSSDQSPPPPSPALSPPQDDFPVYREPIKRSMREAASGAAAPSTPAPAAAAAPAQDPGPRPAARLPPAKANNSYEEPLMDGPSPHRPSTSTIPYARPASTGLPAAQSSRMTPAPAPAPAPVQAAPTPLIPSRPAPPPPVTGPAPVLPLPGLAGKTAEELQRLLDDAGALDDFLVTQKPYSDLTVKENELRERNQTLAEKNLARRAELEAAETRLRKLIAELDGLRSQVDAETVRHQAATERLTPRALTEVMAEAERTADTKSEALTTQLTAGTLKADEFCKQYLAERKTYHLRSMKLALLRERGLVQ